ncbi:MAG: PRC-barrel domain-containing protein [Nitrococcus sp.]|nr:PRC-barrel domain-containing protein [Nitrococcus sp.]
MQTKRAISTVCLAILGLGLVGSAHAEQAGLIDRADVSSALPASKPIGIIGKRVSNDAGDDLGVVTNVLIDPASGQVTAIVVGIGGVFGYGAYEYKVPWQRVSFAQDQAQVLLSVPRDKVSSEFPAYDRQSDPNRKPRDEEHNPGDDGAKQSP